MKAWVGLLRSHAALTRELNAELQRDHGLTINDFEVLLHLSRADGGMRRVDLAESVLLTPSGITRLLNGLEAAGWVEKGVCSTDARVSYAILTDAGRVKLRDASRSHVLEIRDLFESHLTEEELTVLAELLSRLPGATDTDSEDCTS